MALRSPGIMRFTLMETEASLQEAAKRGLRDLRTLGATVMLGAGAGWFGFCYPKYALSLVAMFIVAGVLLVYNRKQRRGDRNL